MIPSVLKFLATHGNNDVDINMAIGLIKPDFQGQLCFLFIRKGKKILSGGMNLVVSNCRDGFLAIREAIFAAEREHSAFENVPGQ